MAAQHSSEATRDVPSELLLHEKLSRLEWLLKRQRIIDANAPSPHRDPVRGQGRILLALALRDGVSTRALSYQLGIGIPTLNEALAKLEKAALVLRQPSETDRRVQLAYLTDEGRDQASKLQDAKTLAYLDCLNSQERITLSELLDKVNHHLEDLLKAQSEAFAAFQTRQQEMQDHGEEALLPSEAQNPLETKTV